MCGPWVPDIDEDEYDEEINTRVPTWGDEPVSVPVPVLPPAEPTRVPAYAIASAEDEVNSTLDDLDELFNLYVELGFLEQDDRQYADV